MGGTERETNLGNEISMEIGGRKPRYKLVGILSCPAIRFFPLYISHPRNKFNLGSVYSSACLSKQASLSAHREHMVICLNHS